MCRDKSDYRGLKKRITAIRLAQEQDDGATPLLPVSPALDEVLVQTLSHGHESDKQPTLSPKASLTETEQEGYEQDNELETHGYDEVSLSLTPGQVCQSV